MFDRKRGRQMRTDGTSLIDRAFLAHFQVAAADADAASANGVLAATNLGAAAQEIASGITDPAVPRGLSIVANVAGVAGDVTIEGTNYAGEAIDETIALTANVTANGNKAFRSVTKITLPAQTHAPAKQVETLPVTAACTQNGALVVTVTSAALGAASPRAVEVLVTPTEATTALVAAAIRTALAADEEVSAAFDVGGTDANVTLTRKVYAANDATLEMALTDAPATGVTVGASTNTTAGVLGVAQVETIAVTAGSGGVGTLIVTVTGTAMGDASPKAVNVAVTADDNDAAEVALAIRTALAADEDVNGAYSVSGADANVILTARVKAANDATLEIALTDADGTGVTVGASANTTAGVAPVQQVESISITHDCDQAGVVVFTVTAAGMTNSPKAVDVWVELDDSINAVATKVRAALAADDDVSAFFTVSGSNAEINLTAKTDAANDGTMAIALTDAPTTSVTVGASANTTAGVAVDTVSVGWNDKLGLPYNLSHNTVLMTVVNNTVEAVAATVTVSATAIESNTLDPNSALAGTVVDAYLIV
jgi:hypothetical protein